MLLDEWGKFKGWAVLEFFLRSQARIHLKGLAKELKISPRTAQVYLKLYEKEGILSKENVGNLTIYSIVDNPFTRELRRAYMVLKLKPYVDGFVAANPTVTTVALYGSAARGDYDSSSDVDMLIVSSNKSLKLEQIHLAESALGMEIGLEIYNLGEIRRLAEKGNKFYLSIERNNVLLYGANP